MPRLGRPSFHPHPLSHRRCLMPRLGRPSFHPHPLSHRRCLMCRLGRPSFHLGHLGHPSLHLGRPSLRPCSSWLRPCRPSFHLGRLSLHPGRLPLRQRRRSRSRPPLTHHPYRRFHRQNHRPHRPLGRRPFRCSCRVMNCRTQPERRRAGGHRRGSLNEPCTSMPARARKDPRIDPSARSTPRHFRYAASGLPTRLSAPPLPAAPVAPPPLPPRPGEPLLPGSAPPPPHPTATANSKIAAHRASTRSQTRRRCHGRKGATSARTGTSLLPLATMLNVRSPRNPSNG